MLLLDLGELFELLDVFLLDVVVVVAEVFVFVCFNYVVEEFGDFL
jgi:hypothetical protein